MLNSFEVSQKNNNEYAYSQKLSSEIYFNYKHDSIFNSLELDDKKIISYGYLFDVRNPKTSVRETLQDLLNTSDDFMENIKFLNGHFILIFNINSEWKLITDAASITPVYVDVDSKQVSTELSSEFASLNGLEVINLNDYTFKRIELAEKKLTDERIERIILDLVTNQYKYFMDKEITLNFRRNRMNKALISILKPVLLNQTLNLRENDNLTNKIGKWLSRDYNMEMLADEVGPTTDIIANTHLMNHKLYTEKDTGLSQTGIDEYLHTHKLDTEFLKARGKIEFNISKALKYRFEEKSQLIYDPYNVIAIQEVLYGYSDNRNFDPLSRIVKILHPSIDFYDFAIGETLLQKYNKLKKQNAKLNKEMKTFNKNEEFLNMANIKGIKVSNNLDGTVQADGITFYPANQKISKADMFEVSYKKNGQGMILIESYFENPKNAHRIKVNLNGDTFTIDEFLNGKFINVGSDIDIQMYYERDYDAASWQKAGKITIKEID